MADGIVVHLHFDSHDISDFGSSLSLSSHFDFIAQSNPIFQTIHTLTNTSP